MSETKKVLTHIGVWKASFFAGVFYGVFGVLVAPILFLIMVLSPQEEGKIIGVFFVFMVPFIYAFIGFITAALLCGLYNLMSRMMGGVEFTVKDVPVEPMTGRDQPPMAQQTYITSQ